MKFTIDETGAANLFIMSRGRGGDCQIEDRDALIRILREFAMRGVMLGLEKSKTLFADSTDSKGGCKLLSLGDKCDCFLCRVDKELFCLSELNSSPSQ